MPNWCYNKMVVYGSPAEVKDFYKKMCNAHNEAKRENVWDLYQVYKEFGYSEQQILNDYHLDYVRGSIISINEPENDYFIVEYESAWSSMIEGFRYLLRNHYKTLKEFTLAEECGEELFINTDISHKFFKEKYYLDIEDCGNYYCESEEEVIKALKSFDRKAKVKSIEDCFEYVKKFNKTHNEYIMLSEYSNY